MITPRPLDDSPHTPAWMFSLDGIIFTLREILEIDSSEDTRHWLKSALIRDSHPEISWLVRVQ